MKKTFNVYAVAWVLFFILFNLCAFLPVVCSELMDFTVSFFVGYSLITLSFIGQMICTYIALADNDKQKTFYKLPLISLSYIGLILSFIAGGVCMAVPGIPYWVGILICFAILVFNIISVLMATIGIGIVTEMDENQKRDTFYIRLLSQNSSLLISKAKTPEMKKLCVRVHEAVRYSDPVGHDALASVEGEIDYNFAVFSGAVESDDTEEAKEASERLLALIADRNKMCRMLK